MEGEEDGIVIGAGVSKDLNGHGRVGDFDDGACRHSRGDGGEK